LNEWSNAFYCPIKHDPTHEVENIFIDTDKQSNLNPFYTFEYREDSKTRYYEVPVNATGFLVNSPVDFIEKLIIEREELYDDNNSIN
jgi:hypothetical protein